MKTAAMKLSNYANLRSKNLQENYSKLKELGVDTSKAFKQTLANRKLPYSCNEDGDWTLKRSQIQSVGIRVRKPRYQEDSDDPDFDADDPSAQNESNGCSSGDDSSSEVVNRSDNYSRTDRVGRSRKVRNVRDVSECVDYDNNLFCEECARYYEGDCPSHGELNIIEDISAPPDTNDENRARATAPREVRIADGNVGGVWATEVIPSRTRFGPYEGKIVPSDGTASKYTWEIRKDGNVVHSIDAKDPGVSNWMRYIKHAQRDGEQNMNAYQFKGKIYYRTIHQVKASDELLVWHGNAYGRVEIDQSKRAKANATKGNGRTGREEVEGRGRPLNNSNKATSRPSKVFKCPGCNITYISKEYADRHMKTCRKLRSIDVADEIHECSACHCAYSTRAYLERHMKTCRKMVAANVSTEMFKCPECNCAYINQDFLDRHKKLCRNFDEKKFPRIIFPCPGCKSAYSTSEYLERHKKICRYLEAKTNPEDVLKCEACLTAFSDEKYLERHRKLCRQKVLTNSSGNGVILKYECSACHSVYTDKTFLERHKKVCEGRAVKYFNAQSSFECLGCHSTYGNLEFFARHKLTCVVLNSSKRTDALTRVEEESHRSEAECTQDVRKKFSTSASKKENLKTSVSDDEKKQPFVLLERVAWFDPHLYGKKPSSSDVSSKPLKCFDCNEQFAYKARLDAHILIHRRQIIKVCFWCKKTFAGKKAYAEHVMSHRQRES